MAETIITVRGRFEAKHPAERATVHLSLGFEGPARDTVVSATTSRQRQVVAEITAMHDPAAGPVTWWTSDQLTTWSERPWNKDGKQLPLVHHSAVALRVKFSDFSRLGSWITDLSTRDGVTVKGIDWALTESRRLALAADARKRAVQDAKAKASDFVTALGLTTFSALAVADPGMLAEGLMFRGEEAVAYTRASATGTDGAALLTPEDITVSAAVDARFSAS